MPIMMGLALGAAVGGGMAALQNKDVLQGALIGGATGAITGGMGGGFGGAGAAATEGGVGSLVGGMGAEAFPVIGGEAIAGSALGEAGGAGVAGLIPQSSSWALPNASSAASEIGASNIAAASPVTGTPGLSGFDAFKADPMKYLGQNKMALAGAGLAGSMLASNQSQDTDQSQDKGMIRPYTYNQTRNPNYTGSGDPYFNQSMVAGTPYAAANGGVVGMANGGIAALGQNNMYPMSQLDQTQYATPSQMPTSAEVVNAGYEPTTNPYTGSEVRMADGGISAYQAYGPEITRNRVSVPTLGDTSGEQLGIRQSYVTNPRTGGAMVAGQQPSYALPEVQAYNDRLMERANQQYNVNLPPNALIVPGSQEDQRKQSENPTQASASTTPSDWIDQQYQNYFGRLADQPGRDYVQQHLDAGMTQDEAMRIMAMQPEHLAYAAANPGMANQSQGIAYDPATRRYSGQVVTQDMRDAQAKQAQQPQQMQQERIISNEGGGFANGGMAQGGIYNLGGYSDGGRLLKGPGDGVSDDIPAQIGAKQPARLADGEFVLPARIVSELGNGSTDAGAKRLYAMMDRVQANRKKSVGKGKVAVDSKSSKYLPA